MLPGSMVKVENDPDPWATRMDDLKKVAFLLRKSVYQLVACGVYQLVACGEDLSL